MPAFDCRTENLCFPGFSFFLNGTQRVYFFALSSLHSNVEPASEEVNVNLTFLFADFFFGFLTIVVYGGFGVTDRNLWARADRRCRAHGTTFEALVVTASAPPAPPTAPSLPFASATASQFVLASGPVASLK